MRVNCSTAGRSTTSVTGWMPRGCTSRSSTAFPTAPSTGRRSRPTSTRRTGATRRASPTRSISFASSRACCPRGLDGGVSTAPLTYKAWMPRPGRRAWPVMTRNVARVAAALVEARGTGAMIHLDIEPEPDCLLETSAETIDFFEQWLLPVGGETLRQEHGLTLDEAQGALLDHVRVCFDCCHFAVEYEDPAAALDRFHDAGIGIGRVQLSSALDVPLPASAAARSADRRTPASLRRRDLPAPGHRPPRRRAPSLFRSRRRPRHRGRDRDDEWRIHFHVPLFASDYEGLGSTQDYVRQVIGAAVARSVHDPSRNRDVHVGRASGRAEDRPRRVDPSRVRVGARRRPRRALLAGRTGLIRP